MRIALAALLALAPTLAEAQISREPQRPRAPTREEIALMRAFPAGERLAVESLNGRRPVFRDPTFFTFSATGRMTGFGGCNPVNADFRHAPRVIRFGPLNFVERRCGGEIDRGERALFWAIQAATSWRPSGARGMTLSGPRGTVVFRPAF